MKKLIITLLIIFSLSCWSQGCCTKIEIVPQNATTQVYNSQSQPTTIPVQPGIKGLPSPQQILFWLTWWWVGKT